MSEPRNRIVLRYERVTYHGVGGIEAHGKRLGDTTHVDPTRTELNEFPIGHADLREIVDAHIARMQLDNADLRRGTLKRRRRRSDLEELEAALDAAGDDPHALAEVVGWPWDPKNVHPFTEGILSVSHEWFLDDQGQIDPTKIDTFRAFAVGYVAAEFGGEVLYARLDLDEKTPHLSFLVAPEHAERRTKRRILSHRQHRLFGQEEVFKLFDDDCDDEIVRRRSYEILQDRVAEFAKAQGLEVERGEQRAEDERLTRALGKQVIKTKNVSPARGRELVLAMASEAAEKNAKASDELNAARSERDRATQVAARAEAEREAAAEALAEADGIRASAAQERRAAEMAKAKAADALRRVHDERAALAAREESMMIGTQAIIAQEMAYAPPTPERAEALTWGKNRPESEERRTWLAEKVKPAREWLIGFARSVFGYQARREAEETALMARAKAVADAEARQGRQPAKTLVEIVEGGLSSANEVADIPGAWAIPASMTPKQIDSQLRGMTNTAICNAYSPTRDARDFAEHDNAKQARFSTALHHLINEAARRGLDLDLREHRPEKASDPERASLHLDSPPRPLRIVRQAPDLVRSR